MKKNNESFNTFDEDVFQNLPIELSLYTNKLFFAQKCGYKCGIHIKGMKNQLDPLEPVIVRPIMNPYGMSLNTVIYNHSQDIKTIPAGYFWCQYFEGTQYSADFDNLKTNYKSSFIVKYDDVDKYSYNKSWIKENYHLYLQDIFLDSNHFNIYNHLFNQLSYVEELKHLNVEYIYEHKTKLFRPYELHFRLNPDRKHFTEGVKYITPVFSKTYKDRENFVEDYEDCEGQLTLDKRYGFLIND